MRKENKQDKEEKEKEKIERNPFKQKIWNDFWLDEEERDTEVIIELLIKEAVERLPHSRLNPSDRLKIKRIDLDFTEGKTLTQFNNCTSIVDIGPISNMTCFVSLRNIEVISIAYFNPRASVEDNGELVLEKSLRQTNLFRSFGRLKKVEIVEMCRNNGVRKVEVNRREVVPF